MVGTRAKIGLTRVGFASRGIMYLIIGYLALRSGRTEDGSGALAYLASGSGRALLVLMSLGFFAYGIWRLSEAIADSEAHGSTAKGIAVRIGGAVSGFLHFGLGLLALKLGLGSGGGGSGGAQAGASTALSLPGGTLMLIMASLAIAATGAYQLVKVLKGGFLRHLSIEAQRKSWVTWMGRSGYAARGIVFLLIAWLLFEAARTSNAAQAGGMAEALSSLPHKLETLVAAGLFLFGLFSLVEARYRQINDPKVLASVRASSRHLR